jgi:hypothetical protein
MVPTEIPANRTPLTYTDMANSLLLAWEITGTQPTRAVVRLACSQLGIETGGGSGTMGFNISGIKGRAGGKYCWQYFTTTEYFTLQQLTQAYKDSPSPSLITQDGLDAQGRMKVHIYPKHPYCCFRAYPCLSSPEAVTNRDRIQSAIVDHLLTMQLQFPHGFAGLLTGNHVSFAHGLSADHWFTAPEKAYSDGLVWRGRQVADALPDSWPGWGDVV